MGGFYIIRDESPTEVQKSSSSSSSFGARLSSSTKQLFKATGLDDHVYDEKSLLNSHNNPGEESITRVSSGNRNTETNSNSSSLNTKNDLTITHNPNNSNKSNKSKKYMKHPVFRAKITSGGLLGISYTQVHFFCVCYVLCI